MCIHPIQRFDNNLCPYIMIGVQLHIERAAKECIIQNRHLFQITSEHTIRIVSMQFTSHSNHGLGYVVTHKMELMPKSKKIIIHAAITTPEVQDRILTTKIYHLGQLKKTHLLCFGRVVVYPKIGGTIFLEFICKILFYLIKFRRIGHLVLSKNIYAFTSSEICKYNVAFSPFIKSRSMILT